MANKNNGTVLAEAEPYRSALNDFLDRPDKKPVVVDHNTRVERKGAHIILPEAMPIMDAAEAVYRLAQEDEAELNRDQKFSCHPDDGRVALMRALKRAFGAVTSAPIQTMFGPVPPSIERIPTSFSGDWEEVFSFGEISVPALPDIKIQTVGDIAKMELHIRVTAKRKHGDAINALFNDVAEMLKNYSIYKGKAIDSKFSFLDVSSALMENLILPNQTMREVQSNLITPLSHPDALARYGIPFKRGVLLEGPYGTGKTSIAYVTAREAEQNDVTFMYVRPDDNMLIPVMLRFARFYAPCVLFIEDIDQFAGGDRDDELQKLLNELDGIVSKQGDASKVMVIMTTNHVNEINPALLRPGRLDCIINVGLPDADAAGRLVKRYGAGALEKDFDVAEAGKALLGFTPAFIRECVERAKLHALSRDPGGIAISVQDIIEAATSIKHHIELATPKDFAPSVNERLGATVGELIQGKLDKSIQIVGASALIERLHSDAFDEEKTKEVLDEVKLNVR